MYRMQEQGNYPASSFRTLSELNEKQVLFAPFVALSVIQQHKEDRPFSRTASCVYSYSVLLNQRNAAAGQECKIV